MLWTTEYISYMMRIYLWFLFLRCVRTLEKFNVSFIEHGLPTLTRKLWYLLSKKKKSVFFTVVTLNTLGKLQIMSHCPRVIGQHKENSNVVFKTFLSHFVLFGHLLSYLLGTFVCLFLFPLICFVVWLCVCVCLLFCFACFVHACCKERGKWVGRQTRDLSEIGEGKTTIKFFVWKFFFSKNK